VVIERNQEAFNEVAQTFNAVPAGHAFQDDAISRFQADHFDRVGFLSAEAFPFIASGRERDRLALCDTEPAGDAVG
jgi:hypothetical protein